MNWDQIAGNWKQLKGVLQAKWGELTDEDLAVIDGNRDQLIGLIQEKYGVAKEEAQKQVNEFGESL